MKNILRYSLLGILIVCFLVAYMGCSKDETTVTGPNTDPNAPTYPVTATIYNPQGYPQGGATLTLQNPPSTDPKFSALTDSLGKATIQSPSGPQVLLAKFGTVFQATLNVTVAATTTPTVITTPLKLQQNTSLGKTLIVTADAEQLEAVLRILGYTTYDSTSVYDMRTRASADSTGLLTWLKQYKLVFSNCNGGDEDSYPVLARVYGRYVASGGKIYGGHYNYMNLEVVWPPYFAENDQDYQGNTYADSMQVVDANLRNVVGLYLDWTQSGDSRHLSGYEKWTSAHTPPNSYTYGIIKGTNPAVSVVVECHPNPNPNGGKYLWTNYHNQDIKSIPKLRKIIEYFMLNM